MVVVVAASDGSRSVLIVSCQSLVGYISRERYEKGSQSC